MYRNSDFPYIPSSDNLDRQNTLFPREEHVQDRLADISILVSSALVVNKAGTYDVSIPENIQEHPEVGSFVILIVKRVMDQLPLSSEDMISAVRSMISEQSLIMLDKKFPGAVDSAVNGWLLVKNANGTQARTGELLGL